MLNNVSKFSQYSKAARLHFYFDQKDEKEWLKNEEKTCSKSSFGELRLHILPNILTAQERKYKIIEHKISTLSQFGIH